MRRFALLGVLACDACLDPTTFACESDAQCMRGGIPGTCEAEGYCSFPDDTCASNRRFAELAPSAIAGVCVVEDGSTSTVPPTSTSVDPSTTTSVGTSTTSTPTTDAEGSSSTTFPLTSGPDPSSSSSGEVELPDPIGWWSMDELEGGMVPDHGTGGTPGMLIGDASLVPGKRGNAVQVNGGSDSVEIGDHPVHDVEQFTFAAWIWIAPMKTRTPPRANILSKGFSYRFRIEAGSRRLGIAFHDESSPVANTNGSVVCTGRVLEPQTWYHVAVTFGYDSEDGISRVRLYVNGKPDSDCDNDGSDGSVDIDVMSLLLIGNGNADAAFNGMIDEVRLYDHPLDASQINALSKL